MKLSGASGQEIDASGQDFVASGQEIDASGQEFGASAKVLCFWTTLPDKFPTCFRTNVRKASEQMSGRPSLSMVPVYNNFRRGLS